MEDAPAQTDAADESHSPRAAFSRRNILALSGLGALAIAGSQAIASAPAFASAGYSWPLSPIIFPDPNYDQEFGAPRPNGRRHLGADFNVNRRYLGMSVTAVADGQVIGGQWSQQGSGVQSYTFGNYLIVRHDDGVVATYAHMKNAPSVARDSRITRGDQVGLLGSTGTNVPHLHLELKTPTGNVDPVTFIRARLTGPTPPPSPLPPPPPPPPPIEDEIMYIRALTTGQGGWAVQGEVYANDIGGHWRSISSLEGAGIVEPLAASGKINFFDFLGDDLELIFCGAGIWEQTPFGQNLYWSRGLFNGRGSLTGRLKYPLAPGVAGTWHYPATLGQV